MLSLLLQSALLMTIVKPLQTDMTVIGCPYMLKLLSAPGQQTTPPRACAVRYSNGR